MDALDLEYTRAATLDELKAKGRLVVDGAHRPILVIYDQGRVFALDNRCPHMGFPLERGSVEDGILTCHWHHARFDLESGCTFDLWADDAPTCPVEVRDGEIWVKTSFDHGDPAAHWRERLADGLAHDLGLVIAKAVQGQLAAGVPRTEIVRQVALFGALNRDGWDTGLTIHTALADLSRAARGRCPSRPVPWRAPRGGGLRWRGATAGTRAAREPARPGRAQALAAALDEGAPSRGSRAHAVDGDRGRPLARKARGCPSGGRYRAGVRRRRTFAGLHQQGVRVPRPDRLGARRCRFAHRR